MKIRIRGNTVRFRLERPEVRRLSSEGYVAAQTVFPDHTFTYAVRMMPGLGEMQAEFRENTISLLLPERLGRGWYDDSAVGFSHELPLASGGSLSLLLEKDFACLEDRGESERGTYPNPKAMK